MWAVLEVESEDVTGRKAVRRKAVKKSNMRNGNGKKTAPEGINIEAQRQSLDRLSLTVKRKAMMRRAMTYPANRTRMQSSEPFSGLQHLATEIQPLFFFCRRRYSSQRPRVVGTPSSRTSSFRLGPRMKRPVGSKQQTTDCCYSTVEAKWLRQPGYSKTLEFRA